MRAVAGIVAVGLLLAGCASATPEPTAPPSLDEVSQASLTELRQEYGLPDCPDTDPAAAAVEGGLPTTALPCLGSDKVVNLAGLPRRPMVINLWAQWCGPCREEAPYLASVSRRTAGTVNFLGIDTADPQPERAIEFAKLAGWTYPQLSDPEKATSEPPLRVPGLPHTIFVDAGGKVVGAHSGPFTSEAELDGYLRDLLGVDA